MKPQKRAVCPSIFRLAAAMSCPMIVYLKSIDDFQTVNCTSWRQGAY